MTTLGKGQITQPWQGEGALCDNGHGELVPFVLTTGRRAIMSSTQVTDLELIPLDTKLADPLLTFMNREAIVRVVSVGDLFASLSSLRRTASHYHWGRVIGVSARDQLIVQLVSGKRVAFNISTGLIEAEKWPRPTTRSSGLASSVGAAARR